MTSTGIYCCRCGYDLRASEGRCPECGRGFDQANPRSFARGSRSYAWRRWRRRVGVALLPVLLVLLLWLWVVHAHAMEMRHIEALATLDVYIEMEPSSKWWYQHLPESQRELLVHAKSVNFRRRPAGQVIDDLRGLPELQSLWLGDRWTSRDPPSRERNDWDPFLLQLASLHELRSVVVGTRPPDVPISDRGMSALAAMTQLEQLSVQSPSPGITDAGIRNLKDLGKLKVLELSGCKMTDEGFRHLAPLTNLENLILDSVAIDGSGLRYLPRMERLKSLRLRRTQMEDASFQYLDRFPSLLQLEVPKGRITDAAIPWLAQVPNLQYLDLSNSQVTDKGLAQLAALEPNLEELLIHHTRITDASLEVLAAMPKLTYVVLVGTDLSEAKVIEFRKAHPALELNWSNPRPVPETSLPQTQPRQ